jgi:hypothetical protein
MRGTTFQRRYCSSKAVSNHNKHTGKCHSVWILKVRENLNFWVLYKKLEYSHFSPVTAIPQEREIDVFALIC